MESVEISVSNQGTRDLWFTLEPWGERYRVPSKNKFRIVVEAPSRPVIEWECSDNGHLFIVYDPAGALATVFDGEDRVPPS